MSKNLKRTLNKNFTACFITAVFVLAAFLIGGIRPLSKLRSVGNSVFYKGTEEKGFNSFNLFADLERYSGYAANVVSVANRYPDVFVSLRKELSESRENLSAAIEEMDYTAQWEGLVQLKAKSSALTDSLRADSGVSDDDKGMLVRNAADMSSLFTIISRRADTFNESAAVFNDKLSAFPAVIFRITGLVKPLGLFRD